MGEARFRATFYYNSSHGQSEPFILSQLEVTLPEYRDSHRGVADLEKYMPFRGRLQAQPYRLWTSQHYASATFPQLEIEAHLSPLADPLRIALVVGEWGAQLATVEAKLASLAHAPGAPLSSKHADALMAASCFDLLS